MLTILRVGYKDPFAQMSGLRALTQFDIRAHQVRHHSEALDALMLVSSDYLYDLILVDLGDGPAPPGLKFIEQMRENGLSIPVLALATYKQRTLCVQALNTGADHFDTIPVNPMTLAVYIRRLVLRSRGFAGSALTFESLMLRRGPREWEFFVNGASIAVTQLQAEMLEQLLLYRDLPIRKDVLHEKLSTRVPSIDAALKLLQRRLFGAGAIGMLEVHETHCVLQKPRARAA